MKKWAAWLLALMLWVSPLAAGAEMAQADKMYTLYLGYPIFSLNEEAEQSVDLALISGEGLAGDGRYILTLSAEGGESPGPDRPDGGRPAGDRLSGRHEQRLLHHL